MSTNFQHSKVPNVFWGLTGLARMIAASCCSAGCQEAESVTGSQPVVTTQAKAASPSGNIDPSLSKIHSSLELPTDPNQEPGIASKVNGLIQQAQRSGADQTKNAGNWLQSTWQGASDSGSQMTTNSMEWANKTFKNLKDQGLTTAESTSDWLTEDWQNMESWEYKIVNSRLFPDDKLEAELNRLGKKGWECFSISDKQMFFKKPRESYLRRLPFKDLLRLAPLLNQGK